MASPKRYKAIITRVHARVLWTNVQNTKAENRTHEDWLSAANRELLPFSEVDIKPGARVRAKNMESPDEKVTILLSFEAMCGIKHAVAQNAKAAPFRERQDMLEALEGFGKEFAAKVRAVSKLPEGDDLDDEKELEGVPSLDTKTDLKIVEKEEPRG